MKIILFGWPMCKKLYFLKVRKYFVSMQCSKLKLIDSGPQKVSKFLNQMRYNLCFFSKIRG